MPTYTTEHVKNLSTGGAFTFEVPRQTLERLASQKKMIATGEAPALGTEQELTETYEFSFFPTYVVLLKNWISNGFTTELITQILTDFGVEESFVEKLLEDDEYVSSVRRWFEGINGDGERAARTLAIVYKETRNCYSL